MIESFKSLTCLKPAHVDKVKDKGKVSNGEKEKKTLKEVDDIT